jgi:hypothetical protein
MSKQNKSGDSESLKLGWFWVGAGLGVLLSAAAVVVATEYSISRRLRRRGQLGGFEQNEGDLIGDLTSAVSGGLNALAETAEMLSMTFNAARSELIKFNLDSSLAGSGSGSSAWYNEDDPDDPTAP